MTSIERKATLHHLPTKKLLRVGLLLLYLLALPVAGYLVFSRVREEVGNSDFLPEFTLKHAERQNPNVDPPPKGETLPQWTGTDRVTVLFLGVDERMQGDEKFWRTDTMILATLDPVTMQAGILSIPRDLWVHIPGYEENRINTAHFIGDAFDHPGGGPALAVQTVEYNLGVDVDYYVRVNFQGFVDMVDLIGGIDIEVPETIDDPCYPTPDFGCERLYIEAGDHHFYGDMALKYARTRHSSGGDFDRARRQQQVIMAILERITQANVVPQLAARAPEIVQKVEDSVRMDPDLQLDEVVALAMLATEVERDDIRFRVIDETCTMFKITPDDMMILIPLREEIRKVRDEIFWHNGGGERVKTVEEEAASVSVLNGTETPGLAYATTEFLTANGIPVAAYDNADRQDYDTSLVILNRDKSMTAMHILSLLDLPTSALVNGANPTAAYDVVVILGADYAESQVEPAED
jgi:LCP family protein required for cell wall assembly